MKRLLPLLFLYVLLALPLLGQNPNPLIKALIKDVGIASTLATQEDGKLLVAGPLEFINNDPFSGLIRINTDGTIDESFSFDQSMYGSITKVLVQKDGKILIAGEFQENSEDVIRLNADGSIDDTFNFNERLFSFFDMALQADDKLLLASHMTGKQIIRLQADGSIDNSFSISALTSTYLFDVTSIGSLQDNQLIIGGRFYDTNGTLVRHLVWLNDNGTINEQYSNKLGSLLGGEAPEVKSITFQADNKILIAGRFTSFNNQAVKNIVRLNEDGTLDASFSPSSIALGRIDHEITAAHWHKDKIVLAGLDINAQHQFDMRIMRLNTDGSYDTSFQEGVMPFAKTQNHIISPLLNVAADDAIYIAGAFESYEDEYRLGIAAIDWSGQLKNDWKVNISVAGSITDMVRQTDGKFVIAGNFIEIDHTKASNLARLNSDGSLDEAFNANVGSGPMGTVNALALDQDQKILVGGQFSTFNGNTNFSDLVRLNPDGTLDTDFNPAIAATYGGWGIHQIIELENRQILLGGAFTTDFSRTNIARINADGSLDMSFNNENILTRDEIIWAMDLQSDGKLIIAGQSHHYTPFVKRVDLQGSIDHSFTSPVIENQRIMALSVLPNDEIIFGGFFSQIIYLTELSPLYRLDKDGALLDDQSIGWISGELLDLFITEDQSLMLGGAFLQVGFSERNGLAQVNLNGSVAPFDAKIMIQKNKWNPDKVSKILKIDNNHIAIGGQFIKVKDHATSSFAVLRLVNQKPMLTGTITNLITQEDTPITLSIADLLTSDGDNDPLQLTVLTGDNYTVDGFTITPAENYYGTLSINIELHDGYEASVGQQVQIEVTPVNDPPVIVDATTSIAIAPNTAYEITLADLQLIEPDNSPEELTITVLEGENYTLQGNTVMPFPDYYDMLTIPVKVSDGEYDSQIFDMQIEINRALGIEDKQVGREIALYPNPTTSDATIILNNNYYGTVTIKVYNSMGQELLSVREEKRTVELRKQLNTSNLNSGLYHILITFENSKQATERLLKNK